MAGSNVPLWLNEGVAQYEEEPGSAITQVERDLLKVRLKDGTLLSIAQLDSTKLNYNSTIGHTTIVGSYETGKSPYGCYDMAGNVGEWCADWYDGNYYNSSPANDPQGSGSGTSRVVRGISWYNNSYLCRSALRLWYLPGNRDLIVDGVRCVRSGAE
jgi:formylglycine-generating enzyme required for sulfatase activity